MKRRRWPDVVIVLAVIALGAGGVWALWGKQLRGRTAGPTPSAPAAGPST